VFLPLVHQMVRYAAGKARADQPPAVEVGQALPLPDGLPQDGPAPLLQSPGGKDRPLSAQERKSGRGLAVGQPGFHVLQDPAGQVLARYAVNTPAAESDLSPVTPAEVRRLARSDTEESARLAAAGQRLTAPSPGDRRIWRSLLAAALVLMLLELWLAGRIGQ